jgi:lysophospholipase L1-like esterase
MNTDIWLYGDSYFSNTGVIRWTGYLVSNGYTNYLLNAYPGRNSLTALAALRKDLSFNKVPRKIVWCLGMNDADTNSSPNANWLSALNSVIAICDEYNIELILATCPIPTASDYDNTYKNEYVRNLGYRYIDFAMAVSADGSNAWYDGMNDDGVHPTAQGALCLFNTAVAHVPELLS